MLGKYLSRISAVAGQVLLFTMTLLITVDVLGRTIGRSTQIADEVSAYMLVALVLLGLAHTQRAGRHVEIELVTRRLPPRRQQQLEIVVLTVSTVFVGWFTWCTWGPVVLNYTRQVTSITFLHTPMWIPWLFIPVGAAMLTIQLLIEVVGKLRTIR